MVAARSIAGAQASPDENKTAEPSAEEHPSLYQPGLYVLDERGQFTPLPGYVAFPALTPGTLYFARTKQNLEALKTRNVEFLPNKLTIKFGATVIECTSAYYCARAITQLITAPVKITYYYFKIPLDYIQTTFDRNIPKNTKELSLSQTYIMASPFNAVFAMGFASCATDNLWVYAPLPWALALNVYITDQSLRIAHQRFPRSKLKEILPGLTVAPALLIIGAVAGGFAYTAETIEKAATESRLKTFAYCLAAAAGSGAGWIFSECLANEASRLLGPYSTPESLDLSQKMIRALTATWGAATATFAAKQIGKLTSCCAALFHRRAHPYRGEDQQPFLGERNRPQNLRLRNRPPI